MPHPSHVPEKSRLLVVELWGLGDLALALPFLRAATAHADVTLLAKPHAAPLLARFAPDVALVSLGAPWTAFRRKYRLHTWPWRALAGAIQTLRAQKFSLAVSARPDPRDHFLLRLSGAKKRVGFTRAGSSIFLTHPLPRPLHPHRAAHWQMLADQLGWALSPPSPSPRSGRTIAIHPGAAQPTRLWPASRYAELAARLRAAGWQVVVLPADGTLDALLDQLARADRFIGNDSGPSHLAALLGVPTFTIFGPQLPERFAPQHPGAAWIEGAPCPHKPCFDACRFAEPHCLLANDVDAVWSRIVDWLNASAS